MQRYCRAEGALFVGLWLILAAAGRGSLFQDPGTFWHTVVGRQIVATGEVPRTDSLSFTWAGQPWVATQWLAECLMAGVHGWLGWDGLLLLTVTCLAGLFTYIASRLLAAGLPMMPTLLVVTVVTAASSHHFHARPHLATLLFVPLLTGLFVDIENGRCHPRRLWWCLPMLVLWTNMHGGALAGWGLLLLAAAGWIAWQMVKWPSPLVNRAAIGHALGVVCLGGLALLASPYGLDTPRTWLKIMSLDLPGLIEEHAPLNWHKPEGQAVLVIAIAYVATLASTWRHRPRVVWLLPLLWAWLAVGRVRHAPLFALSAAVAWADMLPYSVAAGWLRARGWLHDKREPFAAEHSAVPVLAPVEATTGSVLRYQVADWRVWLLPMSFMAAVLAIQAGGVACPVVGRGWARLDPAIWPVELVEQLNDDGDPHGPPGKLFNALDLGGFVTFYAPHTRTFIDDRCELFGGDFLRQYAAAETRQPGQLDDWARQYGLRRALVRSGSPFDLYLARSADWQETGRARSAVLYQRRPAALAAQAPTD
ncbi:MAG: hypothetical protein AB7O62_12135 [Pirellulales bacterium]